MAQGIPKLNCKRLKSHRYLPLSLFLFSLSPSSCDALQPSEEHRLVVYDLKITSFPKAKQKNLIDKVDHVSISFFHDFKLEKFPLSKEVKIFNPSLPSYKLNIEGYIGQTIIRSTPSEELQNWLSSTSSNLSTLIKNNSTVIPQKESFYNSKDEFKNTISLITKAYTFAKVFFDTPKLKDELIAPKIVLTSTSSKEHYSYTTSDLTLQHETIPDKLSNIPIILTLRRVDERQPTFIEAKSTIFTSEEKIELEKIPVVLKELPEIFNSCFLAVEDALLPSHWDTNPHVFSLEDVSLSKIFNSKEILDIKYSDQSTVLTSNFFDEHKIPLKDENTLPKAELNTSLELINPLVSLVPTNELEQSIYDDKLNFLPQSERYEPVNIEIKRHNPKLSASNSLAKNTQPTIKESKVYQLNDDTIENKKSTLEFQAIDICLENSSDLGHEFLDEVSFLDYLISFKKNNSIQQLESFEDLKIIKSKSESIFPLQLQNITFPIGLIIQNDHNFHELSKDPNYFVSKENTLSQEYTSLYQILELITKDLILAQEHDEIYFSELNKKLPSDFFASIEFQDKKHISIMNNLIQNYPKLLEEQISYISMLSANEDSFNPLEIANIEKTKSTVDFSYRSLLRKKGLDYLSLMPSLKDLNTYVLSTEFRNETEVIASPDGESYYFSIKLHPYYPEDLRNIHQNVFFVLDQSRTISEERFETFKKGILRSIPFLNSDATFNIVVLNKNCDVMNHTCLNNDKEALSIAKSFLDNISYGFIVAPQDYNKALESIQKRFSIDETTLNTVILLTDGAYYKNYHISSEKIFDLCNNNNNIFQLYTVAASQDNYLGALDMISYHNHGELLYSKTHAALPRQLAVLVKNLRNPVANHLHLSVVRNESNEIEFFPRSGQLPAIFANQPLTIYGKTDRLQNIDLMIQGKAENEWINITQKINLRQAIHGGRELLRTCQMLEKKLNYFTTAVEQDET